MCLIKNFYLLILLHINYCRVQKELQEKRSILGTEDDDSIYQLNEHDYVPHYQRVAVSGEDTSGVSLFYI